jgi:hypothetical protein
VKVVDLWVVFPFEVGTIAMGGVDVLSIVAVFVWEEAPGHGQLIPLILFEIGLKLKYSVIRRLIYIVIISGISE